MQTAVQLLLNVGDGRENAKRQVAAPPQAGNARILL